MKMLFFITGLSKSGAERQMYNLIKGLVKKGAEVKVISLIGGHYVEEYPKLGVEVKVCGKNLSFKDFPKYIKFFKREVRSFKPDIVHSFLYHTNLVAKFALFSMKKDFKLVCSYQSLTKKYPTIAFLEYFNMHKTDLLITNSHRGNKDLDMYNIFGKKRKVIYNGFLIGKLDNKKVLELKKKFKGKKVVTTIANLRPEKDFLTNVRTCFELSKKRDDFVFVFGGEGPVRNDINNLAKELNISDKIILLGKCDYVLELLKVSDVFFMPTLYESQSNSLMEAMYMKVPIVTTDLLENRELVKKGLFCKIGDSKDMAKNINLLLDKKKLSKNDIEINHKYIKEKLTFDNMVDTSYKVYKELM